MYNQQVKFIADEMLGKLSKWLRICGYDTLYFRHMKDAEIIRLSIIEKRILLTRDTLLVKRKGLSHFLLISFDQPLDQLKEVVHKLILSYPSHPFSRCLNCNSVITAYPKSEACRTVPDFVCMTKEVFGQCPQCRKVFWKGTHYDRMLTILKAVFEGNRLRE